MVSGTLTPVLTAHWDEPDSFMMDGYRRAGGYRALARALSMPPGDIIAMVKQSGLRGRGGAGSPPGRSGGFIPQGDGKPHYLVVNADESEPSTCKDVPLMVASPHLLIEGAVITAYASGSVTVPVQTADMPARVLWLPTHSAGCEVRRELGAGHGTLVTLRSAG